MAGVEDTATIKHTPGNLSGVQSTFETAGMSIEDIDRPGGGRRFNILIPKDTGTENFTPDIAAKLGEWLIAQAARRATRRTG